MKHWLTLKGSIDRITYLKRSLFLLFFSVGLAAISGLLFLQNSGFGCVLAGISIVLSMILQYGLTIKRIRSISSDSGDSIDSHWYAMGTTVLLMVPYIGMSVMVILAVLPPNLADKK